MTHLPVSLAYSSFGKRLLAFVLDSLILVVPCAIASQAILGIGSLIVLFFYAPILESSEIRATLGKRILGIQVTDLMGQRITLRAAIVRNFLKFVSSVVLFIGFFFALFTQKKQALHDLLADTLVVYGRTDLSVADAWVVSIKKLFQSPNNSSAQISELERLQALRDKGALTEEEFLAQKSKVLCKDC